jgi:hypothetical protein
MHPQLATLAIFFLNSLPQNVRHEEERVFSLILSSPSPKSTKKTRILRQNTRSKMENNEKVVFLSKKLFSKRASRKITKKIYMYFLVRDGQ